MIEDGAYFKGSIDILKPGQKADMGKATVPAAAKSPSPQPTLQMAASEAGKG